MPNTMRRPLMALLPPAFSFAFSLVSPGLTGAQAAAPAPFVQITFQQASLFASAFNALSQQAKVTIVAEDQPLYPTFAAAPASSSARHAAAALVLKKEGEPLSTLLPKLAAAYDYDVQPSGKAFLLRKRYTDAADLPSVTVKECALGLEEASRYAENFDPHFPNGEITDSPAMKDLIYSLTPEQLQAMGDGKRGVPVASLSPVQQQEVWQFLLHFYVQRVLKNLPDTVGAISRIAATDPQFSWRDLTKITNPMFARQYANPNTYLFGYDATLAGGQPIFVTMSKPDQTQTFLTGGIRISPRAVEGVPQEGLQIAPGDVTDPLPVPANAPKPAPPVSSSLAEILTRLNARAADGLKDNGLKVSVEPYLAPKRVTVFGEALATPRQEVGALAELYGLRVLTEEKEGGHDRLRLTRQTAQVPLNVLALHDSLLQSLPAPLVRACPMHPTFGVFDPTSPIPYNVSPLLVYAVRQIRTAAEPKIRASKDGKVALSALSEEEGRAFAMTLMADTMESLRDWTTTDMPKEFARFNELRLAGGLHEENGKQKMDFLLDFPYPNNPAALAPGLGVGGINYDPVNHTL